MKKIEETAEQVEEMKINLQEEDGEMAVLKNQLQQVPAADDKLRK
jgi:hypothetical protein